MENVKINNLRIAMRFLIYDVLRNEHERLIAEKGGNIRNVLRRSGFGINIRSNQGNYFMRGVQQNLRNRIRGRIRRGFTMIPFQYEYELYFAFTDDFTDDEKREVLNQARDLHSHLEFFLFNTFNNGINALNLHFDTYDSRCFIGLYETPERITGLDGVSRINVRLPIDNPVVQIVHGNGAFLKLKNYTPRGYIDNSEVFYNIYVERFLNEITQLEPEFELQAQEELDRYQETLIVVSPGLSVAAFNILLNLETEDVVRALYVSWSTRIGFSLEGDIYRNRWLRNINISDREIDNNRNLVPTNAHQWVELFNFREAVNQNV